MAAIKKQSSNKETIYVDVDDEITNIIEKVKSTNSKIVALVLPKRATVMQSVVNMRLLKKAADNAKKNIVLITNEAGLLPLAGAAEIHVAKSLQSKPEIPPPPKVPGDDADEDSGNVELDKTAAIGTLAAMKLADDETETIELDNINMDTGKDTPPKKDAKKNRRLKVPNFDKFRLSVFLGILGAVLLFMGWLFAFVILPKATIEITTDTTTVVSSFDFRASTAQAEVDVEADKIPAISKTTKKSDSQKAAATGQKDEGTKASGKVTLSIPCSPQNFGTQIPTGTAVSNGSLNFITQETATLNTLGNGCELIDTVSVLAAENGDKYNIGSGQNFAVAGFSSVDGSNSNAFSGGTSNIVKIVSQEDIDNLKNKIIETLGTTAKDELKATIKAENLVALDTTLFTSEPKVTPTPKAGEKADEVTVAVEVEYSMLGVKSEDLEKLIENDIKGEVDLEKQAISDYGIDSASMNINGQNTKDEAFISFRGTVTAGPEIDTEGIKKFAAGKKRGEIEEYVNALPGVEDAVVEYSPFWVMSTPKATKKITVKVINPDTDSVIQNNDESRE